MDIIKPLLHSILGRSYDNRNKNILHASDITNDQFCAREFYLHNTLPQPLNNVQFIPTATKITWQYGRFIEETLRNEWLMDHLIGVWRCLSCEYTSDFCTLEFAMEEHEKEKHLYESNCKSNVFIYNEYIFYYKKLPIVGSPDCFLIYEGKYIPIEIKTIDKDAFYMLKSPQEEHVLRCQFYLSLLQKHINTEPFLGSDKICTDYMQIVYFSKAFGIRDTKVKKYNPFDREFSPIKEYTIEKNEENVKTLWDKVVSYDTHIKKNKLPTRICDTIDCSRAKVCNVREQCFAMEN